MKLRAQHLNLPRYGLQVLKSFIISGKPSLRLYGTAPRVPIPLPPALSELTTDDDNKAARNWADRFKAISLPRSVVELTFARSPGPGGQVWSLPLRNKVHHITEWVQLPVRT